MFIGLKLDPLIHLYIYKMDPLTDVLKTIQLAQEVAHRPLQVKILQGCIETLQAYIATPQPSENPFPSEVKLPASEDHSPILPDIETSSTHKNSNRYVQFVSTISPYLRRLNPGRPQKHIITEAAKLWKLYKNHSDHDEIIAKAQAHAAREVTNTQQHPLLSISIPLDVPDPLGSHPQYDLTP